MTKQKTILFLTDGLADETLDELGGKTPLEAAHTPNMDRIAREGASGTFLTLPEGFSTSSDVANMSVLGYDIAQYYCGRGPLEAMSQGIDLKADDIAYRCNLIQASGDTLVDYSGGHISDEDSQVIMKDLIAEFNCPDFSFYAGISYRNLLVLHGDKYTAEVIYEKPDASMGMHIPDIVPKATQHEKSAETCKLLIDLMQRTRTFLEAHPYNQNREEKANMIWPSSPGKKPDMLAFRDKYGVEAAVVAAVDVIFGLGACADMSLIHVDGATGYIDTNYEGKAAAAVKALENHDFVYLHVEAADEVGHMGDLDLKIKTIEEIDRRFVGETMRLLDGQNICYAVAPDHPVAVKRGVHTRTPVPFAICGDHISKDESVVYSETEALKGGIGYLEGDKLMRQILNCQ